MRGLAVNLYLKAVRKFAGESDAWWKASKPSVSLQPDASDKMRFNLMCWAERVENVPVTTHRHSTRRHHVAEKQPASSHARISFVAHFRCCASRLGKSRHHFFSQPRCRQNYMACIQPKPCCRDERSEER